MQKTEKKHYTLYSAGNYFNKNIRFALWVHEQWPCKNCECYLTLTMNQLLGMGVLQLPWYSFTAPLQ